jgi:hypothetical protein
MGQHIKYPERQDRRGTPAAPTVRSGEPGVPFKCEPGAHHWRLNARPGDRRFCGERQWPEWEPAA